MPAANSIKRKALVSKSSTKLNYNVDSSSGDSMVVTTQRDMLTVTRASLLSLRAALLRSGDAHSAVTLQEAGYAGGTALYESFKAWLAERTHIGVEDLDVDAFQHRASEYFSETGW